MMLASGETDPLLVDPLLKVVSRFLGVEAGTAYAMVLSAAFILVYLLARILVGRVLDRRVADLGKRYMLRRTLSYVLGILLFLVLVHLWIRGALEIGTFLGLMTAGLAIALQEPIVNFAGWIFIIARAPFKLGDRVEVEGGPAGDVIDIRLFMFSVLEVGGWVDADQSTGRIIHVPNAVVFRKTLANYTQGFDYVWNELPVTVTFESDWKKAHAILERIVVEHAETLSERAEAQIRETARKFMIYYTHLKPIVWVKVADVGVTLTIRYICNVRKRRSSADTIWRAILEAFGAEPSIDFAYPTVRYYDNRAEGKPGAGGVAPASPAQ
jgi:small-conductance mechanosensitive channel